MDVEAVSQSVALIAATGGIAGLSEAASLEVVRRIRERLRTVFGGDQRSRDALDDAMEDPEDPGRIEELTAAVRYYARRDEVFGAELARWAGEFTAPSVTQNVRAGRDVFAAGRDMTVERPAQDG